MPYPAKITVITVCLNMARTIEQTIKSVLDQNYPNLEYIIIDGASSDGTLDIIKKYEGSLARVVSEPDNGSADALNKGIRMASGDIIAFLPADDFYAPWTLETFARAYEDNSGCDVYHGKIVTFDKAETCWKVWAAGSEHELTDRMNIQLTAGFLPKRTYDKWGLFDVRIKIPNDWDYILKIYLDGASFHQIDKVLTARRLTGMSNQWSQGQWWENYRILAKYVSRKKALLYIGKLYIKYFGINLMKATGTYGIYKRLKGRKNRGIEISDDHTGDAAPIDVAAMWNAINAGENSS